MPPRPFPYLLRVGTDICNVARLQRIISRGSGDKRLRPLSQFITRVLTQPERKYFWDRFGPPEEVLTKLDAVSQFLAGRFAAKEACRKACDHMESNSRGFQQIMILPITPLDRSKHQSFPPRGLILDQIYREHGIDTPLDDEGVVRKVTTNSSVQPYQLEGQLCEISISHDGDFATAVAIVPSIDKLYTSTAAPAELMGHAASTKWDSLLNEVEDHSAISPAIEERISEVVDKGLRDLRRRNSIVDQIRQLRNKEKITAAREQKVFAECTVEERQRWGVMFTKEGLSVPQLDEGPEQTSPRFVSLLSSVKSGKPSRTATEDPKTELRSHKYAAEVEAERSDDMPSPSTTHNQVAGRFGKSTPSEPMD